MAETEPVPEAEETGPAPVWVQLLEAKPNKLFTEEERQLVVFLRFSQAVPCAECGKRSKHRWTMLLSFAAHSMLPGQFTLAESGKVHLPCAPVCRSHLLLPAALKAVPAQTKGQRRG